MISKIFDSLKKIIQILNTGQRFWGTVVFLCSILTAVFETLGVSIIVPLVNVLLSPNELWNNRYISIIANKLDITTNNGLVVVIVACVIVVYILKNAYFSFYSWIRVKYACKVQRECSVLMMKSYMNRGYSFFAAHNVNELNEGVTGDVALLYSIILNVLQSLSQILIVIFICIYMCISDWQIAISVVIAALICLLLIYFVFRKQLVNAGFSRRKWNILASRTLYEAFYGIKEVMVMRKQHHYLGKYEKRLIKSQRAQVSQTVGGELPGYIIEAICVSAILVVLCFRITTIADPTAFVATLASFAVGAFRVLPALGKISSSLNVISSSLVGLDSVYNNVIEAKQNVKRHNNIEVNDNDLYLGKNFERQIDVVDLSFRYRPDLDRVLSGLNLTIFKGESVAFVGESGAGKSTLADLVLGILDPEEGRICMDGIDIKDIPNLWSSKIAYVPQSIYLSDTSIRENVAFGVNEDEIDDDAVREALEKADILEHVNQMPEGIYGSVGDRGIKLSGGQRQRIGIARALYRKPDILVLDEATSALDNETEKAVMQAIDSLHGTMTMIIIAHRFTTVKNCDHIFEIVDGKAAPRTYDELIKTV